MFGWQHVDIQKIDSVITIEKLRTHIDSPLQGDRNIIFLCSSMIGLLRFSAAGGVRDIMISPIAVSDFG